MNGAPPDGVGITPPNGEPVTDGQVLLSSADRTAAFATGRAPVDRKAALRSGSVPVPRKFVLWIIVGFAVLGLGGIVAEHFVGNAGVESVTSTPLTTLAGTRDTPPSEPAPPSAPPINASVNAFIGLTRLTGHPAPSVTLRDQNGTPWTLGRARGQVVVLTFFNAECNDICPVLADEIAHADALLGRRSADVTFVVVNSDPLETALRPVPPALTLTGLKSLSNVVFLNGPVSDLNRLWIGYGVTVAVQQTTRVVTHTDIMYFINPEGRLTLRALPFADENQYGVYGLDSADTQRFAQGIAIAAKSMLGGER